MTRQELKNKILKKPIIKKRQLPDTYNQDNLDFFNEENVSDLEKIEWIVENEKSKGMKKKLSIAYELYIKCLEYEYEITTSYDYDYDYGIVFEFTLKNKDDFSTIFDISRARYPDFYATGSYFDYED